MTRPRPTCQFIADTPSADDACKCGAPAIAGQPWCREHYDVVFGIGNRHDINQNLSATFMVPPFGRGVSAAERDELLPDA